MSDIHVSIRSEYITLDAFLKWAGVADTGGHAKSLIGQGIVKVNGEVETRRGRKLRPGDRVFVAGFPSYVITSEGA